MSLVVLFIFSGCDLLVSSKINKAASTTVTADSEAPTDNTTNLQFTDAFDTDGDNITITWNPFSDNIAVTDYRIILYTDSLCTLGSIDLGLIGSGVVTDNGIVDGIPDGTYYATVTAYDAAANSTVSACSTDSIVVDTTAPTDNAADLQFTDATDADGDNLAITWITFTDNVAVTDHRIILYTNSSCSAGANDLGLTGASTNSNSTLVDGIANGTYYATVTAYDAAGNSTVSACSTDSIVVDTTAPTDNTASLQFTDVGDNDGDDIAITWTPFTDNVAVTDHRIILYTNNSCNAGAINLGLTGSSNADDNGIADNVADGTYYATVTAYDAAGNSTVSACSADSIIIDSIAPTDNTANLQFTSATDADGNNIAVTWTAFSDNIAVTNHRITLYTNNTCTNGTTALGLTGSANANDNGVVDLIPTGTYYGKVTAYDASGNSTTSACSTDSIVVTNTSNTTKITASDGAANDWYGMCVSISENNFIIGAKNDDDNINDSGSVYIYQYNPSTGLWDQSKLTASDGATNDFYGYSVAISGNKAVVGAYGNDTLAASAGAAYLYEYNPATDLWDEQKFTASDGAASDNFGHSVAIHDNSFLVGAYGDDSRGSAYLYQYKAITTSWVETKITASDRAFGDNFGFSVGISDNNIIVGNYTDDGKGSAYIYQFNPTTYAWNQTKLTASDGAASDNYGYFVSISGNTAAVGAVWDDDNGAESGSAYIYQYNPSTYVWEETKLIPSDGAAGDRFGRSVSVSGNNVLIGANADDDKGADAGSAYLFRYNSSTQTWKQSKLTAADGAASDSFGLSVAISGNTSIIGAFGDDAVKGSAYLTKHSVGLEAAPKKILASDGAASDNFGSDVAISGNNIIVGAYGDDDVASSAGAAYIYQYNPDTGVWDQTKLTAIDGAASDNFGQSVAISQNNALVGAHGHDATDTDAGSAYIYQFNADTGLWVETKILASDGAASDHFGLSVAISGNNALIGAYGDDGNEGAAYLYQYNYLTQAWVETKLTASDAAASDNFGYSVAISGNIALVGAYGDDDNGSLSGSAYIYQFNPTTHNWDENKLTASDAAASDNFGWNVAISGTSALVGAYGNDDVASSTGSAYIYQYNPDTHDWDETKLTASDAAANDNFGYSVAISGNTALVGAYGDDDKGSLSGSAYIYQFNPTTKAWDPTKHTASDGAAGDYFGTSVAISATTALIGSSGDDDQGSAAGSAYLINVD